MKHLLTILILCISFSSFSQDNAKGGLIHDKFPYLLQGVFIFDGVPFENINDLEIDKDQIKSVKVFKGTVFNRQGVAKYAGIVAVYTKDSIHTGLKYILSKTNDWMYKNPLTQLEINGKPRQWNTQTAKLLFRLKPEDILAVRLVNTTKNSQQTEGVLQLKIKD